MHILHSELTILAVIAQCLFVNTSLRCVQEKLHLRLGLATHIIDAYLNFCGESQYAHLSKRTLYRVLKEMPASQRKSLAGMFSTVNSELLVPHLY